MTAVFDAIGAAIGAIASILVTLMLWLETFYFALLELMALGLAGQWYQFLVRVCQLLGSP